MATSAVLHTTDWLARARKLNMEAKLQSKLEAEKTKGKAWRIEAVAAQLTALRRVMCVASGMVMVPNVEPS